MDPITRFLREGDYSHLSRAKIHVSYMNKKIPVYEERCKSVSEFTEKQIVQFVLRTEKHWAKMIKMLLDGYKQHVDRSKNKWFGKNKEIISKEDFIKHCVPIGAYVYCQDDKQPFTTIYVGDDEIEKQFGRRFEFVFDPDNKFFEQDSELL